MAAKAENTKKSKILPLFLITLFQPVAIETSGSFGLDTATFIRVLGRKLKKENQDVNSCTYLVQRLSVAVQRGNAASVPGTMNIKE